MAAPEKKYQKLPGRGLRRSAFFQVTATFSWLWLGEDHLLLVDSNHFAESYKRFYFRDIEGIILTRTSRRRFWNVAFLILVAIFGGISLSAGLMTSGYHEGAVVLQAIFIPLAALFLLLALINSLRGPTCRCDLTTAAQTDQLASLHRLRRAEKVLARLRPIIAAAQEVAPAAGETTFAPPSP